MKNKLLLFLFLLSLIPFTIYAKGECDNSSIKIESIELNNINGEAEETKDSYIDNSVINLDLVLHEVNDSVEYKILVDNNSSDKYFFNEESLISNTDYIEYSFHDSDNNNYISPNTKEYVYLVVKYKTVVPDDKLKDKSYKETNNVTLQLSNNNDNIINPPTSTPFYYIISIVLVLSITIIIALKKEGIAFVLILLIIPITVYGQCNFEMVINSEIVIDKRDTMFLPGENVNIIMKQLALNDTSTDGTSTIDENITGIVYSNTEPSEENKEDKNIVSTEDSRYPIYMWYDNGIIYWYSEEKHPKLNEDSSIMFRFMINLKDIDSFANFNTSKVKSFARFFYADKSIENISPLANWDTSNVENLFCMFAGTDTYHFSLTSLEPLRNWNTSKVTDMSYTFQSNTKLTKVDGLENWDTSNVTTLKGLFLANYELSDITKLKNWNTSKVTTINAIFYYNECLVNLEGLEDWDISSVTDMAFSFAIGPSGIKRNNAIIDLTPLSNWDVSNVVDMSVAFQNVNITSYEPLANWNVSKVQDFGNCFNSTSKSTVTTLHGLENWDVSSATRMTNMFFDHPKLEDASAINDWDVTNVVYFSRMFGNSGTHPNFTKVNGTWSSNGSFVKSS